MSYVSMSYVSITAICILIILIANAGRATLRSGKPGKPE